MNGFEALRGAYRNHLNSEEERMVREYLVSRFFCLMYFFFKQVVRIIAYFVLKTKFLVAKILCRKNVQFCTAMH